MHLSPLYRAQKSHLDARPRHSEEGTDGALGNQGSGHRCTFDGEMFISNGQDFRMQLQVSVTFGLQAQGQVRHLDAGTHLFELDGHAVNQGKSMLELREALEQQGISAEQLDIIMVTASKDVRDKNGNCSILGLPDGHIGTSELG